MSKRLTYYKATRTDGRDFHTGTVDYAGHLVSGEVLTHRVGYKLRDQPWTYFSVSVEPGETLIGGFWPCRLFRIEPVGSTITSNQHPYKRGVSALRVIEELPAWLALGPNGREVAAIIERAARITTDEARSLVAAWVAAQGAAWDAARAAARAAARDAAWAAACDAAWDAARDAAWAWLVRDKLTETQFQALAGPWLSVIGEPDVSAVA